MTAQVLECDRERFEQAGFDAYASKPLDLAELDAVLARCLPNA